MFIMTMVYLILAQAITQTYINIHTERMISAFFGGQLAGATLNPQDKIHLR